MFKWLKRRRETKEVIEEASEVSANKPARQVCVKLLTQLDPARFEQYEPNDWGTAPITTLYRTVALHVEHINVINARLIRKELLAASVRVYDTNKLTVDQFFAVDNGYYVDPVKSITEFKASALKLCELLASSDNVEVGDEEWNLRVLTGHLVNIREITTTLLKISR